MPAFLLQLLKLVNRSPRHTTQRPTRQPRAARPRPAHHNATKAQRSSMQCACKCFGFFLFFLLHWFVICFNLLFLKTIFACFFARPPERRRLVRLHKPPMRRSLRSVVLLFFSFFSKWFYFSFFKKKVCSNSATLVPHSAPRPALLASRSLGSLAFTFAFASSCFFLLHNTFTLSLMMIHTCYIV